MHINPPPKGRPGYPPPEGSPAAAGKPPKKPEEAVEGTEKVCDMFQDFGFDLDFYLTASSKIPTLSSVPPFLEFLVSFKSFLLCILLFCTGHFCSNIN